MKYILLLFIQINFIAIKIFLKYDTINPDYNGEVIEKYQTIGRIDIK